MLPPEKIEGTGLLTQAKSYKQSTLEDSDVQALARMRARLSERKSSSISLSTRDGSKRTFRVSANFDEKNHDQINR